MEKNAYLHNHIRTNNIAVIVPMDKGIIELSFFQTCTMGVCEAADTSGYDVMLVYSEYRDFRHLKALIDAHKIDGVIITRTCNDDKTVEYLKEVGIPFVTVGSVPDTDVVQVDQAHEEACEELTTMSILKGRKRIAFMGNDANQVVNQRRFNGYCQALRNNRKRIDPQIIFQNVDGQIQAEEFVAELIEQKVDSIVCIDEKISYWVYKKLHHEKIPIPEQIEICSCYHSNALENYIPSITTIKYDTKQLGSVACDRLIDMINGQEVPQKTLLSYEFNIKKH